MWTKLPVVLVALTTFASSYAGGAANTEQHKRAQDDYYASDLHTAISEAKVRTHHYDYSKEHRYNRTTSQSIQFSRMLNDELDSQMIETPSLGGINDTSSEKESNLKVATVKMLQDQDSLTTEGGNISTPQATVTIPATTNNNISITVTPRN